MAVPLRRIALLIDLNGTLHVDKQIIPGCIEALKRLRRNDRISFKFLTNTTLETTAKMASRLQEVLASYDIAFHPSELTTSLSVAKMLVQKRNLRPMLLLEDEAMAEFEAVDQNDPNTVVVGYAPSLFNYETMNKAFRLLMSLKNPNVIAIHMGRFHKMQDGLVLGPGPFVEALQYATGAEVEVIGKPAPSFFKAAHQAMGGSFKLEDTVMIGDDVRDDVIGAINAGMRGILVQTGKYRSGDELLINEDRRNCVAAFAEAVDLVERSLDDPHLLK